MPAGVTHTQARAPRAAGPAYRVELADVHAHLFGVQLRIARPAAVQRLSLPVWIPGSYLVREFARHLQGLQAQQGGMPVAVVQCDKCTWEVACDPSRPLELHYQVYAFDNSVRAAWLDAQRAFFNGTSLFLRVHGQEEQPHALALPAPRGYRHWQLATGLAPAGPLQRGFGNYVAADYDTLVDSPVEMGPFWRADFQVRGIPHALVVAGAAPSLDGDRFPAAQPLTEQIQQNASASTTTGP